VTILCSQFYYVNKLVAYQKSSVAQVKTYTTACHKTQKITLVFMHSSGFLTCSWWKAIEITLPEVRMHNCSQIYQLLSVRTIYLFFLPPKSPSTTASNALAAFISLFRNPLLNISGRTILLFACSAANPISAEFPNFSLVTLTAS